MTTTTEQAAVRSRQSTMPRPKPSRRPRPGKRATTEPCRCPKPSRHTTTLLLAHRANNPAMRMLSGCGARNSGILPATAESGSGNSCRSLAVFVRLCALGWWPWGCHDSPGRTRLAHSGPRHDRRRTNHVSCSWGRRLCVCVCVPAHSGCRRRIHVSVA